MKKYEIETLFTPIMEKLRELNKEQGKAVVDYLIDNFELTSLRLDGDKEQYKIVEFSELKAGDWVFSGRWTDNNGFIKLDEEKLTGLSLAHPYSRYMKITNSSLSSDEKGVSIERKKLGGPHQCPKCLSAGIYIGDDYCRYCGSKITFK